MKYVALIGMTLLAAGCVQQGFDYNGLHVAKYGDGIAVTGDIVIYFNPSGASAGMPVADYVFLSDDNCDKAAAERLSGNKTHIIGTFDCVSGMKGSTYSMTYSDSVSFDSGKVVIRSTPGMNGNTQGNGYIVTLNEITFYYDNGDARAAKRGETMTFYYNNGDRVGGVNTSVDMAFLTYAGAAKTIKPKIVVPIGADAAQFKAELKGTGIEVRVI